MPNALVICLDAKLRATLFSRVGMLGHRVDAVADRASAEKRFAKDPYDFAICEDVIDTEGLIPDDTTKIEVDVSLDSATIDERLAPLGELTPYEEPAEEHHSAKARDHTHDDPGSAS
ncbi:MAG: hypothetical protein AAF488_01680 [Planctomycetota bacterium]